MKDTGIIFPQEENDFPGMPGGPIEHRVMAIKSYGPMAPAPVHEDL